MLYGIGRTGYSSMWVQEQNRTYLFHSNNFCLLWIYYLAAIYMYWYTFTIVGSTAATIYPVPRDHNQHFLLIRRREKIIFQYLPWGNGT